MDQQSMQAASQAMKRFYAAADAGKKVFYGPLYSTTDLNGIAVAVDPTNRILPANSFPWFSGSLTSGPAQGFARSMRLSETNLDGAAGQLPAGYAYIAFAAGVYYFPQLPPHIKDSLDIHSAIEQARHSNRWQMGASRFWPAGVYGHQSQSVSTTIANALIQYGVNGTAQPRKFPKYGEMHFPPNETIQVNLITYEPITMTTDGLPWNGGIAGQDPGGNGIPDTDGARVSFIMEGWRFEWLAAA